MKNLRALLFLLLALLFGCQSKEDPNPQIPAGKNRFTITVDGAEREYYVHVPSNYTGDAATPVVIMCHGTSGDGALFYNISGWKEVGETENILTVYPSALRYCVEEDGETKNTTKWNSFPGGFAFCPGANPKDDVKFMRQMIAALQTVFNVDAKRIYIVGFSNGGQFAATCAVQMSDLLAAAVSCGGGGSLPRDSTYTPVRLLPVMLLFGNKDGKMIAGLKLPEGSAVPMGFSELYAAYPYLYSVQPLPYIKTFRLKETGYTTGGDPNIAVEANYAGLSGNPDNVFKMVEVKGLDHEYPNGINHPIKGAVQHWAWFKQYRLP